MRQEFEYAYLKSMVQSLGKGKVEILPYIPADRRPPSRRLEVLSAWQGIEDVLGDLIERFHLGSDSCLEFGVEHGFSTVALSSYFKQVTGVDTFQGDRHTKTLRDLFQETSASVAPYDNIHLIKSDYRDFIRATNPAVRYNLIHVDIIHTFADTYACGLWSANHSDCTIFHDTESYPAVKQAVREIARSTGKKFYNLTEFHGLGILV